VKHELFGNGKVLEVEGDNIAVDFKALALKNSTLALRP